MDLVFNFGDNSFGFHTNQGIKKAVGVDVGGMPALLKVLRSWNSLGQTHGTNINSDLL